MVCDETDIEEELNLYFDIQPPEPITYPELPGYGQCVNFLETRRLQTLDIVKQLNNIIDSEIPEEAIQDILYMVKVQLKDEQTCVQPISKLLRKIGKMTRCNWNLSDLTVQLKFPKGLI